MPFTPETIALKPYNKCIRCEYLGVKCDGPNVIAMSKERFCEWCRQLKDEKGWSNATLAEKSGLSKATIDKIMANRASGLNGETISTITCALVYGHACPEGNWGRFPCAMEAPDDTPGECPKCAALRLQLGQQSRNDREKIDFLKQQVAFKEEQMRTKDKHLEERANFIYRKDRVITILSVLLGISVLLIISALLIDLFNPNIGFFWLEHMAVISGLR